MRSNGHFRFALLFLGLSLFLAGCAKRAADSDIVSARKALSDLLKAYPAFTSFSGDGAFVVYNTLFNDNIIVARDFGWNNANPDANKFFPDVTIETDLAAFEKAGMDPVAILGMED